MLSRLPQALRARRAVVLPIAATIILLLVFTTYTQVMAAGSAITTTMLVLPTPVADGQVTTLSATVTASGAPVTIGFVTFFEGSVKLGTASLGSNGTATLKRPFPPGQYSITARFDGSNAGQPSVSASAVLVQTATAGTTLTYSFNSSGNGGQGGPVTFTANVTSDQAVPPTGTVTFIDETTGTTLGSAQLSPLAVQSGLDQELLPPNVATYINLYYYTVVAGDFTGNGLTDYAVLGPQNPSGGYPLDVFLNVAPGIYSPVPPSSTLYNRVITTGDFNNDGKTDIVSSVGFPDTSLVLISNGDGTFTGQNSQNGDAFAVGDFNGDGYLDLVDNLGSTGGYMGILLGDGTGNFTLGSETQGNVWGQVADYNNDGNPDLIAELYSSNGTPPASVGDYLGNGTGNFSNVTPIPVPGFPSGAYLLGVEADFNADGNPDMAVYDGVGNIDIFLGTGNGSFLQPSGNTIISTGALLGFSMLDVNGDGIPDLVGVLQSSLGANNVPSSTPGVLIMLGDGTGHFNVTEGVNSAPVTYPLLGSKDGIASTPSSATSQAQLTVSELSAGSHTIVASYSGNPVVPASVSAPVSISAPSTANFSSGFAGASLDGTGPIGLNGSGVAKINGSALELTDGGQNEASSAFYPTPLDIRSFVTDFTFQLTGQADGITFAIQNQYPSSVGGTGGSLGFAGLVSSVGVKFDLFNNQGEGDNSTGLYTKGATPTVPAINLGPDVNLHSGDIMHAHMLYDGTTLQVTLTDTVTSASVSQSYTVNIPQYVNAPHAYVGFTGATGALTATQQILTWSFSSLPYFSTFIPLDLTLNGGAELVGPDLHMIASGVANEAHSAFFSTPVDVTQFTTDFTFSSVNTIADGFTFTLQNVAPTAVGQSGGGLGYAGISNSAAVKFDLYSNAGEGTDSTGLFVNGVYPTVPAIDLTNTGINLHSEDPIHAHMVYDGTTLTVTLTDTVTNAIAQQSYTVNIPAQLGASTGWVGFTAGTGALSASTSIQSWSYIPTSTAATANNRLRPVPKSTRGPEPVRTITQ